MERPTRAEAVAGPMTQQASDLRYTWTWSPARNPPVLPSQSGVETRL